jgi:hypothetical protein
MGPIPHSHQHGWDTDVEILVNLVLVRAEFSPVTASEFAPTETRCPVTPALKYSPVKEIFEVMLHVIVLVIGATDIPVEAIADSRENRRI